MDQHDGVSPRFVLGGKRLLIDLSIVGALAACQIWGSMLLQTGSRYVAGLLTTGSLVMAFGLGKALGARRGSANI